MILVYLFSALMCGLPALAETGGVLEISASVVAGGGISSTAGQVAISTTAGQPITQPAQDGNFSIQPGFWPLLQAAPPTSPPTAAATVTATATSPPPPTRTPTATPANSATPTRTSTPSPTPPPTLAEASPTPFPSPFSPTPAATATPASCTGDCDGDGAVTVDEIIRMVNIALTGEGLASCSTADLGGDGMVSVEEIIVAVNHALDGCDAPLGASSRGVNDEKE